MWPVWMPFAFYLVFFVYIFILRGQRQTLSPAQRQRQSRIAVVICTVSLLGSVFLWTQLLTHKRAVPVAAPMKAVPAAVVTVPAS